MFYEELICKDVDGRPAVAPECCCTSQGCESGLIKAGGGPKRGMVTRTKSFETISYRSIHEDTVSGTDAIYGSEVVLLLLTFFSPHLKYVFES